MVYLALMILLLSWMVMMRQVVGLFLDSAGLKLSNRLVLVGFAGAKISGDISHYYWVAFLFHQILTRI